MRLLSLLAVSLVTACVSSGTQVKDSALAQFHKGVTTEADVTRALGPPQGTTTANGMRMLTYAGMHAQTRGATFIPIVGLFAGGADVHSSAVVFSFGPDGRLTDMFSHQADSGARSGIGAGTQPAAPDPKVVK